MTINLKIVSILFILIVLIFIFALLKKNRLNIKYAIVWIVLFIFLLIFTLIPGFLEYLTHLFGFINASNMIFSIFIALLVILTIVLTMIVSSQDKKIRILIQEISLLKEKNGK